MRASSAWRAFLCATYWALTAQTFAQSEPAAPAQATNGGEAERPALNWGAYVETYYEWNFNRPSNRITNYRGFDNRHDSFTLANVALDVQWDVHDIFGRVTLQIGHTPSTYYRNEPAEQGTNGADATGPELWKYLQQAYVGYRIRDVLTLSAGIFLSPIGPEVMVTHDNWNWSRSNLFFGCPFYHTGARARYALAEAWSVTLAVYNGWNSVVDNNNHKSLSLQVGYGVPDLTVSLLYFGGVERASGAPEGQPWRNLFDAFAIWMARPRLGFIGHLDAGWEDNRFGTSGWVAAALSARAQLWKTLYFAARGDVFREYTAHGAEGRASSIFWPAQWVSSGTFTLDLRLRNAFALMLEFRHDQAQAPMYFGGVVREDPSTLAFIPNRRAQNTLTLGATAWY